MDNFLQPYFNKLKKSFLNPELELRILLNKSSLLKKELIISNFNLEEINLEKFDNFFERRINKEPISKIFNMKCFWKYDFFVTIDVLDPRPETELIIEKVLEFFPNRNKDYKILDMCTGSGCLAISLAKEYLRSEVIATDISKKAIEVAKINAKNLKCNSRIKFIKCDLINQKEEYDIVVSNPPYLSFSKYKKTSIEIQKYEPRVALIANNNGYQFYNKISRILPDILYSKSRVFLEIGSTQAKKAIKIFKSDSIKCMKVEKDINNLDRILILKKS